MKLSHEAQASAWMLLSACLYSLQNAGVVFSGNDFSFWTICVGRGLVGSILMLFFLLRAERKPPANLRLLAVRSILGGLTVVLLFYAVLQCGLVVSSVLTSTSPLWAACLAPKDHRWSCKDVLLGVWAFTGVVVLMSDGLLSPGRELGRGYYMGVVAALGSSLCQAGVNITVRGLKDDSPALVSFWGMMGSVVVGLPGAVVEYKDHAISKPGVVEVVSLMGTGILSALAQYCKTYSIQIAGSVSVLVLRHMEVVFSLLLGMMIFHEALHWNAVVGLFMIVSACVARSLTPALPDLSRCCCGRGGTGWRRLCCGARGA
jgi:drug/metabolite transporter (DMT)-like permease